MRAMRRRALILHYAGDVTNYLTGVSADIENIKNFLRSNYGGAWEDSEITVTPNNSSVNDLKCYFNESVESTYYYLIFYTGHGSYIEGKGSIYWLNNQEYINDAWLQNCIGKKAAAMLISDSCQVIEKLQEGGILEQRSFSVETLKSVREECRVLYNETLRKLPSGMFVTASSVSPGEEAAEDSKLGGYYIHSLLQAAKKVVQNNKHQNGIYGIGYIHSLAYEQVEQLSNGKQTPYLKGYTRSSQPPFVVKIIPSRLF